MTADVDVKNVPFSTKPLYQEHASKIALYMAQRSVSELEEILRVNPQIALDNQQRYQTFHSEDSISLPAIFAYSGVVFKHIDALNFSLDNFSYAQKRLRLTSFTYGLLRPLDLIKQYRMEGNVILPELGSETMFNYWKGVLTDQFIADINETGGVLCNLASNEMRSLFYWPKVKKSIRKIITPEFKVFKNGKLKTIVVYTKMCRGEMAKYIIQNKIENTEDLKNFEWEGFSYNPMLSTDDKWMFTSEGF